VRNVLLGKMQRLTGLRGRQRDANGDCTIDQVVRDVPYSGGVRKSSAVNSALRINQALYRAEAGSDRGLDATIGFDWSPDDVNRQNRQITGGVRYNGLIPGRAKD
jgi:hypothetical protein